MLGECRRESGRADCVPAYEEALALSERLGERAEAAACAVRLGHVYLDLPDLRNLGEVERWYRRSRELEGGITQFREGCLEDARYYDAKGRGRLAIEYVANLKEVDCSHQEGLDPQEALDRVLPDAVDDRAIMYRQLGSTYTWGGDLNRALPHYRQAIHYEEEQGNLFGAAQTRLDVARALHLAGRQADALEYAHAALRGFEAYGDSATEMIQETQKLIEKIRG